jgi:hypothetical protein
MNPFEIDRAALIEKAMTQVENETKSSERINKNPPELLDDWIEEHNREKEGERN